MSIVRRRSFKLADRREEIAIVAPLHQYYHADLERGHADRASVDDQEAAAPAMAP
jgi:hypothetical protein